MKLPRPLRPGDPIRPQFFQETVDYLDSLRFTGIGCLVHETAGGILIEVPRARRRSGGPPQIMFGTPTTRGSGSGSSGSGSDDGAGWSSGTFITLQPVKDISGTPYDDPPDPVDVFLFPDRRFLDIGDYDITHGCGSVESGSGSGSGSGGAGNGCVIPPDAVLAYCEGPPDEDEEGSGSSDDPSAPPDSGSGSGSDSGSDAEAEEAPPELIRRYWLLGVPSVQIVGQCIDGAAMKFKAKIQWTMGQTVSTVSDWLDYHSGNDCQEEGSGSSGSGSV